MRVKLRPNLNRRICLDTPFLFYGHYRIAYLLRPSQAIDVLGVFHGALDIARYLP